MRRFLTRTCFAIPIVGALAIVTTLAWLQRTGGEWTSDRIKPSSPFHRFVENWSRDNENEIRTLILSELPIGSPLQAIENFVERHFTGCKAKKLIDPVSSDDPFDQVPHVYLRVWQSGNLSGSEYLDLVFALDDSDYMKDVYVSCNGAWL